VFDDAAHRPQRRMAHLRMAHLRMAPRRLGTHAITIGSEHRPAHAVNQLDALHVAEADTDAVTTIGSELVTNSVQHAATRIELHLRFDGTVMSVQVRDNSRTPPQLHPLTRTPRRDAACRWSTQLAALE
jgi:hypothetical protein